MIGTQFYKGQGLGNQLWAYSVVRSLAEEKRYDFGFLGIDNFKGVGFHQLDFGKPIDGLAIKVPSERVPKGFDSYYREELVRHSSGADISPLDPKVREIKDGTFVDGTFQTTKYFVNRDKVRGWFDLNLSERKVCVISLRGGEYRGITDLFLPKTYFFNAMNYMSDLVPGIHFEVVTDDLGLALDWFPSLPVYSSGGVKRFPGGLYVHPSKESVMSDFARVQSASFMILANSSFSWWAAFTNPFARFVIAPKYWARFNTSDGYWSNGDSLTEGWLWLDRSGNVDSYEKCHKEYSEYREKNKNQIL
jgi:hypothetical protein